MEIDSELVTEIRTKLEESGYFSSLKSFIPCHCMECFAPPWQEMNWHNEGEREYPKLYTCELCKRSSPWCKGADDQFFEFCDNCAEAAKELTE